MLKLFFILSFTALSTTVSISQNISGGFGHAYFGMGFNIAPNIQNDLRNSSLLGNDLKLDRITNIGGGGGYAVFGNRIMLGGSGFGYKATDATSRGQATLYTGGGFVNLGYLLTLKKNMFGFPYIGIGGNGMKVRLKNSTSDESFNIDGNIVLPGGTLTIHSRGVNFEVGYGVKFLTFSIPDDGGNGGFMIGLQAGTYIFAGLEDWHEESTNDMLPSLSSAYSFSPYVRLTIGGGGFSVSK